MATDRMLDAEYFLDDGTIHRRLQHEKPLFGINDAEVNALYERSRRHAAAFVAANPSLRTFVMFIGNSRSGHSLIGACLDAHPEMIVAHELDYIRFFEKGFSRNQILYMLYDNSRHFARVGRGWGPYSYAVPGQWQGRHATLKVIGDKKAGATTSRFMRHPYYLNLMQRFIAMPMKILHVVRDPRDMVASLSRHLDGKQPVEAAIELVRARCATNLAIANALDD